MPPRALASGTISFGPVSIPFKSYPTARRTRPRFTWVHGACGAKLIRGGTHCPTCDRNVPRADAARGHETARGVYVRFADDELRALESARTDDLELLEFVPTATIDAVHIRQSLYIGPAAGGDRACVLLADTMRRRDRVAIGRLWSGGRESLVLLAPYRHGLILHFLHYADEILSPEDLEGARGFQFKAVETSLADRIVDELEQPAFRPEKYRDEYAARLRDGVERKVLSGQVSIAVDGRGGEVIDLLDALRRMTAKARV